MAEHHDRGSGAPRLLLLQGANMAYLGKRQPELYGTVTAAELDAMLQADAARDGYGLEIFYTHIEGEAIGRIYQAAEDGIDALVMNPAGFNYAGYALADCLRSMTFPIVEVHMTNIERRGIKAVTTETAHGVIAGFGIDSYRLGIDAALRLIDSRRA